MHSPSRFGIGILLLGLVLAPSIATSPGWAASEPSLSKAGPLHALPPTAGNREAEEKALVSRSGAFALTFPGPEWFSVDPDSEPEDRDYDLVVHHPSGGAWVKGRLARRSNRGIEGSLIEEASHAKYLIDYEPDRVTTRISPDSYRASALYCGRRRQGIAREACSLVLVTLHGRRMVQLHSLVDAATPRRRENLQRQVEAAFESLRLLDSGPGK